MTEPRRGNILENITIKSEDFSNNSIKFDFEISDQ